MAARRAYDAGPPFGPGADPLEGGQVGEVAAGSGGDYLVLQRRASGEAGGEPAEGGPSLGPLRLTSGPPREVLATQPPGGAQTGEHSAGERVRRREDS